MTPRPFVEQHARDLTPGRALDLACGSGANAVWLADLGWDVTAVDRTVESLAAQHHPRIQTITADLEQQEFEIGDSQWDLVVVSHYLQRDLFPPILLGLKPGGRAIIIVHLFEPGHEQSRFSVHPGELRDLLDGGNILVYEEGNPHGRATARAVIQRKV